MEEWKTYKLGDIASMKYGKLPPKEQSGGNVPIYSGYRYVGVTDLSNCKEGTIIVVARGVGGTGDVKLVKEDCFLTNLSISVEIDESICLPQYFYYKFSLKNLKYLDSGSAQSQITIEDLKRLELSIPTIHEQMRVVSILKSLDDKIELNNRINHNLEEQIVSIFDELCVNRDGCTEASLTAIADYCNGLAMQKFPAAEGEKGLPVLKIKELGQGFCDESSDRCTSELKPDAIINDGDVVFSWSGTLLVDMWCGGTCGLNQHLFKVQSSGYPKWFYYMWTKHHLENFIHIAKDKAVTMGHIKRGHLDNAIVDVPSPDVLDTLDKIFCPMLEQILKVRLENRKLREERDLLLPRLMTGELTC